MDFYSEQTTTTTTIPEATHWTGQANWETVQPQEGVVCGSVVSSNHLQYIDPTINVCKYWFSRVHSHSSPTTSTTTTALWVCHLTAQMSCAVHSQLLVEWGLPASDPPLNVEHTKAPTTRHTPSPVYVISTCPASMQCTSPPPPLSLFSLNVITSILISRSRLCRPQMDYYYYYGYTLWLKGARTNDRPSNGSDDNALEYGL